jgi:hypothetical protein
MSQQSGAARESPLRRLPGMFTYAQARRNGIPERILYRLRDAGQIEAVGRGLYRRTDVGPSADIDLLEVASRAPQATLCLTAALARHGLTDEIPATIDIALPRGRHRPVTTAPVAWHGFDPDTFDLGRTDLHLDELTSIGLYGPERSIIDTIRLRHREGPESGYTALRRWLARPGSSPAELLAMAHRFPQAEKAVREALEILL